MKIIIAGATGLVGKEVACRALSYPEITSIVALGRRETIPDGADERFKSVVCDDFGNYSDDVKKELVGADACIWLIATTPAKSNTMPWEDVCRTCLDYTMTGLETLASLPRDGAGPLRFIYTSGSNAERDAGKKPWILGDYCVMRGQVESRVLEYAQQSRGAVEACILKPGLIQTPKMGILKGITWKIVTMTAGVPFVNIDDVVTTLLEQATKGIERSTLLNDDLIRIGQEVRHTQELSS